MCTEERFVEIVDIGRLAGILHLPDKISTPCPLVIYCPGKNAERSEVHRLSVKLGRQLSRSKIALLRFDYYGLGLSDGFYHEMTTSTKVSNVIKFYNFARNLPEIDSRNIFLLGFSDGARIALMAANQLKLDRLILWSPTFYEFSGNIPNSKIPKFQRHPTIKDILVMPWLGLWMSIDYYKDLKKIRIVEEINEYKGKSLIIYGDNDLLVQEEFTFLETNKTRLYINDTNNKVIPIPRGGHLFCSTSLEHKVIVETEKWISNFILGHEKE